jgi:hypothetical protein
MGQNDLLGLYLDPLLRLSLQILSPKAAEQLILLMEHNYHQAIRIESSKEKLQIVLLAGLLE